MKTVFGMTKNDFMSRVFDSNTGAASGTNCLKMWEKYFDDHAPDNSEQDHTCGELSECEGQASAEILIELPGCDCIFCHIGMTSDMLPEKVMYLGDKYIKESMEGKRLAIWSRQLHEYNLEHFGSHEPEPTKKEKILNEELEKLTRKNSDLKRVINAVAITLQSGLIDEALSQLKNAPR